MNVANYNKTPVVSYYKNTKINQDSNKKPNKNDNDEYYSPFLNKEKFANNEFFTNTYKAKPQLNSKKLPSVFELPKESFIRNMVEEEKKVYQNINNPILHKQKSNIFRDTGGDGVLHSYERQTLFEHVCYLIFI